jgi:hypothetical protein
VVARDRSWRPRAAGDRVPEERQVSQRIGALWRRTRPVPQPRGEDAELCRPRWRSPANHRGQPGRRAAPSSESEGQAPDSRLTAIGEVVIVCGSPSS